ncbi:MAG: succinyldiaminopimelate transaminase [Halioglobus sp.]|nr:succinyldiaminopimelate transaminase [Halioglobus sp.]
MNPRLDKLQPYPFARLQSLFDGVQAPPDKTPIRLSIGEPQHAPPPFVLDEMANSLPRLAQYPTTAGTAELRSACAQWLQRRFQPARVDAQSQVLPVNGTREALFAFAQAMVDPAADALVMSPNPFYQIYEGAALMAGATPRFINCEADSGLPAFDQVSAAEWARCQLLYICTPGNPTGAVLSLQALQQLVRLAREYDFIIASDECYTEIYPHENDPPPGLLQACAAMGDDSYSHCVVFHSLSKRSNLPGLRSGFVAGDADVLAAFLQYRTYHGCAMPGHHQAASIAAWSDEAHVRANRDAYREKFSAVIAQLGDALPLQPPAAGFYLWPQTPVSDTQFARDLYASENVVVLPGRYLARECDGRNPGADRVRMALVAPLQECVEAAARIAAFLERG